MELEDHIAKFQKASPSRENLTIQNKILQKMEELLEKEELFLRQRSQAIQLKEGDKNMKLFHQKANQRTRRNTIKIIKAHDGGSIRDEKIIGEMAHTFFHDLFSAIIT